MKHIEIDCGSGFCFGVTTAIKKAEEELSFKPQYLIRDVIKEIKKEIENENNVNK